MRENTVAQPGGPGWILILHRRPGGMNRLADDEIYAPRNGAFAGGRGK